MPLPAGLLETMAGKSRAAESRARWDTRRDVLLTALLCLLFSAAGIALIGAALHTTDRWAGRALFWGGLALGNCGIIFTLLAAYRRGERRGDW
jgi:hypothetical protein